MDLVLDANILFAALIKDDFTSELIFSDKLCLFAPDFLISEFYSYEQLILVKTNRKPQDFAEVMDRLEKRIVLIPREELQPFIDEAKHISPDVKDVPYVAAALKLKIPIWSNDAALKQKQDAVKVYSTEEISRQVA